MVWRRNLNFKNVSFKRFDLHKEIDEKIPLEKLGASYKSVLDRNTFVFRGNKLSRVASFEMFRRKKDFRE